MANLIQAILSVIVAVNIILGLIIFSRGVRSLADLLFGLIALTSAVWGVAIIGFYSEDYKLLINWVWLTHTSALLISFLFLIFSFYFPQNLVKKRWFILLPSFLFILTIVFILGSELIIGQTLGEAYYIGPLYFIYAILLVAYFFSGFYFLRRQLHKAEDQMQRKQVQYVLVGSLIASSLAIIPNLILPYLGVFQYTWLGPIFTLLMVISLFLAMLRYHLFSVKVILTELVSVIIVVALLLELFFVNNTTELLLKAFVLVIVSYFSYILIRGVYSEVRQREHIELLATDLKKANARLTELDRQKSEFVSFATHQLRAPLTAMKGYASLILEGDLGKPPEEVRQAVSRIFESTNTLTAIVDDYLNVTRIELGTMKYAFDTIDLRQLVEDTIAELKPNIEKSKLQFLFTSDRIMVVLTGGLPLTETSSSRSSPI